MWPLLRTLLYSFTDARLDTPDEYELIGFANYLDFIDGEAYGVLADPLWWQAIGNTLWFTVISVSLELFFGLLLALLMNQKFRGQGLVRTAILVPWAIPTIVTAKMFSWMFHDQYGTINDLLMRIGMIDAPLAWIAEPTLSLWAVVIADVWKTIPFMALMLLAALICQFVCNHRLRSHKLARIQGACSMLSGDSMTAHERWHRDSMVRRFTRTMCGLRRQKLPRQTSLNWSVPSIACRCMNCVGLATARRVRPSSSN